MPQTKVSNNQIASTLSSKTIDNTNVINTDLTKLAIAGGTNGQVLSTNGTGTLSWTTAGGGVSDGDKGDITVTGSGTTWTIDPNVITNSKISSSANISLSKLQSLSTSQLVGTSSSSGAITAITLGSGLTMSGTTLSVSGGGGTPPKIVTLASDFYSNTTNINAPDNVTNLTVDFVAGDAGNYFFQYVLFVGKYDDMISTNTISLRIGNTSVALCQYGVWRYEDESVSQFTNRTTMRNWQSPLKVNSSNSVTINPVIVKGWMYIDSATLPHSVYIDIAQSSSSGYGIFLKSGSYAQWTRV